MNDVPIRLEHVDLLDRLDRLHVHLLERRLQLLVVGAGALVHLFDLSSRSALASASITVSCLARVSMDIKWNCPQERSQSYEVCRELLREDSKTEMLTLCAAGSVSENSSNTQLQQRNNGLETAMPVPE